MNRRRPSLCAIDLLRFLNCISRLLLQMNSPACAQGNKCTGYFPPTSAAQMDAFCTIGKSPIAIFMFIHHQVSHFTWQRNGENAA
jgi:hypothetical protein